MRCAIGSIVKSVCDLLWCGYVTERNDTPRAFGPLNYYEVTYIELMVNDQLNRWTLWLGGQIINILEKD